MNTVLTRTVHLIARRVSLRFTWLLVALTISLAFSGCGTTKMEGDEKQPQSGPVQPEPIVLREGDVIRVDFPGAPSLNVREQINRDGKITMMSGQVTAAGKTLEQLQKEILDLYSPQLVTKIVTVTLESSAFPIYVSGAVMRPGRINIDRPMTALEAVMEAGVDHSRANLKNVRITRNDHGLIKTFHLNLDEILSGRSSELFYLAPSDIIYVPQKFQWF